MNQKCNRCGTPPLSADARYCIRCGQRLQRGDDAGERRAVAVTSGWAERP
jgi:hypothetical protein